MRSFTYISIKQDYFTCLLLISLLLTYAMVAWFTLSPPADINWYAGIPENERSE